MQPLVHSCQSAARTCGTSLSLSSRARVPHSLQRLHAPQLLGCLEACALAVCLLLLQAWLGLQECQEHCQQGRLHSRARQSVAEVSVDQRSRQHTQPEHQRKRRLSPFDAALRRKSQAWAALSHMPKGTALTFAGSHRAIEPCADWCEGSGFARQLPALKRAPLRLQASLAGSSPQQHPACS